MKEGAEKLLASELLKEIADSSNPVTGGDLPLTHEDFYNVLQQCL